jgi:hypothetical protein
MFVGEGYYCVRMQPGTSLIASDILLQGGDCLYGKHGTDDGGLEHHLHQACQGFSAGPLALRMQPDGPVELPIPTQPTELSPIQKLDYTSQGHEIASARCGTPQRFVTRFRGPTPEIPLCCTWRHEP